MDLGQDPWGRLPARYGRGQFRTKCTSKSPFSRQYITKYHIQVEELNYSVGDVSLVAIEIIAIPLCSNALICAMSLQYLSCRNGEIHVFTIWTTLAYTKGYHVHVFLPDMTYKE